MGALVDVPAGPRRSQRLLAEFVVDLENRVLRALERLHAAAPRLSAIPRAHLSAQLPDLETDALIFGIVHRLEAAGKVAVEARTVALKGYEPRLNQAERRLKSELWDSIHRGGMSPPDASELAAAAGARAAVVPDLLALLRDEQKLVEISSNLYLDSDVEAGLRRKVIEHLSAATAMTMAELRDLLGTTRKYAVPIGEYLDRIGLTRREGDLRKLGQVDADVQTASSSRGPS
jgi:selenocysteine-specific elongation factor